jgi:hypothetical protein
LAAQVLDDAGDPLDPQPDLQAVKPDDYPLDQQAVRGRETEVLEALRIPWQGGSEGT